MPRINKLRRMALAMKGVVERAHMGHPDFRVNDRIFATLHADPAWGMVKLTPEQQQDFVSRDEAFVPENGAWGRQGCTAVQLEQVDDEILGEALTLAWQNVARQPTTRRRAASRPAKPGR